MIMKTLVLLTALVINQVMMAGNYHETMKQTIEKIQNCTSIDELNQLAALFTRIGDAEKDEWLPRYYACYAYSRTVHFMSDGDSIDSALDKAQAIMDDLLKSKAEESEVHVLQAMIYSLRITNPMRGYKYSSLSNQSLERAEQLNASNPRIYYCKANNVYHTPKMFGGGSENAQKLYEKAKQLFSQVKNENDLYPTWGNIHNEMMLKKCLAQK